MSGGIFLIKDNDELVRMDEAQHETEALFQKLLANYPDLLAGDQMNPDSPRKWLLIAREFGVPGEDGGSDHWSLDHLFLDQDGIPTLVEVKRSTDSRIRREVVGQMLDYAANGVAYWPVEKIQARFDSLCQEQGVQPEDKFVDCFGEEIDQTAFWEKVKTNLTAGKVRLVFVADRIPRELGRVVEFLNEQMDPAEVLAVEIKQYVGQGQKTLVPRVIGITAESERRKTTPSGRQWDEASFFDDLTQRRGKEEAEIASKILAWGKERFTRIWWGRGKQNGSFVPVLDLQGQSHYLISVYTYGRIEIQFQFMKERPYFDKDENRHELRRRLNAIPGIAIPEDGISRRPSIDLSVLADAERLKGFLDTLDRALEGIRGASAPNGF